MLENDKYFWFYVENNIISTCISKNRIYQSFTLRIFRKLIVLFKSLNSTRPLIRLAIHFPFFLVIQTTL